jgi:heme/copper-type cytochrome/quinol oxidase subunit 1
MLTLLIVALVKRARAGLMPRRWWLEPGVAGFGASAALTLTGFICGALISGSNVMIPAHYHASIGGVTAAFMAAAFPLMEHLKLGKLGDRGKRAAAIQPLLFGVGQVTFVVGLALAGLHGMARKVYGAEQQVSTAQQHVGLAIMAIGGVLAVAGGGLFVILVISAWRNRQQAAAAPVFREA